jgi:hypothetical protein
MDSFLCADGSHKVVGKVSRKFKAFPIRGDEYKEHLKRKDELLRQRRQPIQLERAVNCYKPVANHQNNVCKLICMRCGHPSSASSS